MKKKIRVVYAASRIQSVNNNPQNLKSLVKICQSLGLKTTSGLWNVNIKSEERNRLVFEGDKKLIDSADATIADVSSPSLGVGWELAYSQSKRLPILAVASIKSKNISAMILGNPYISFKRYKSLKDLKNIIKEWINK